jgi:hypothetical protein
MYERGVPGGALNLNSTGYPNHGRYADLFLQGKIRMAEPGIESGTSWLEVTSSDHQATRLVSFVGTKFLNINLYVLSVTKQQTHVTAS